MTNRTDTEPSDTAAEMRTALGTVVGKMMAWKAGDATPKECAAAICELLVLIECAEVKRKRVALMEYEGEARWGK